MNLYTILLILIHITPPFTNENGYLYPTPQNQDWVSLLNWVNQIEPYQKPPDPVSLYDFVVVGGGGFWNYDIL